MRRFAFEVAVGLFIVSACVFVVQVSLIAPKLGVA